jgi:hypothetical protein
MLPSIGVPETIRRGLAPYRPLFCRDEGFEHVSRYVTGLILSPNKTLQGLYEGQVWGEAEKPSRRAMHEAVLEAGWDADACCPSTARWSPWRIGAAGGPCSAWIGRTPSTSAGPRLGA